MRRLLWVGDAGCDSGFARCTHKVLDTLRHEWDVTVLALNYRGDPHKYPYPMYPALKYMGDPFGVKRILEVCTAVAPDMVVIQNDPWNIPAYVAALEPMKTKPVLVGAIAIDGKNCQGERYLNGLDHAIFWTEFAQREAVEGGFTKPSHVVPMGVDRSIYSPGDRDAARKQLGWADMKNPKTGKSVPDDAFVFLNVNRNQPRKRMDLTYQYFADFVHNHGADNAYLYMHVAPTGDSGYDLRQLTRYYGLQGRVILVDQGIWNGASEQELVDTYRAADVLISTTQGEGWGLTTLEAMACGLPCIVPDWSALGDWARTAARLVTCSTTALTPNNTNVVGGIPDRDKFVYALREVYFHKPSRDRLTLDSLSLAKQPQFDWANVGRAFGDALNAAYNETLLGV